MQILPVVPSPEDEAYAITQGFQWIAFDGTPIRGTPGYPETMRVRQFMSPKQMKNRAWKAFFRERNGAPATGDEPLSYKYCSSGCNVALYPQKPKTEN